METPKISYKDLDVSKLIKSKPIKKQSKPIPIDKNDPDSETKQITYFDIPIEYTYTVDGKNIVGGLYVEGPEMYSNNTIYLKPNTARGYPDATILTKFDINSQDVIDFINIPTDDNPSSSFFNDLYNWCKQHVFNNRGEVGLKLSKLDAIEGAFPYPIYFKRDLNNQPIPNTTPSKFFNLLNIGKPGSFNRKETMFTIPDDSEEGYCVMNWDDLIDVESKFKPLIHINKIYVGGGKASIQSTLVSAIVTHIAPINNKSNQVDTMTIMLKNKDKINQLKLQLEQLRASRSLKSTKDEVKDTKDEVKEKTPKLKTKPVILKKLPKKPLSEPIPEEVEVLE